MRWPAIGHRWQSGQHVTGISREHGQSPPRYCPSTALLRPSTALYGPPTAPHGRGTSLGRHATARYVRIQRAMALVYGWVGPVRHCVVGRTQYRRPAATEPATAAAAAALGGQGHGHIGSRRAVSRRLSPSPTVSRRLPPSPAVSRRLSPSLAVRRRLPVRPSVRLAGEDSSCGPFSRAGGG